MVDLNLLQSEARPRHEGNAEPMVQRHQIGFNENTRTIGLHMKVLHRKAAEALCHVTCDMATHVVSDMELSLL